jgi:hypothetical protein
MVGQGHHLELPYRSLIFGYAKDGKTAEEIHDIVFRNSTEVCTLSRLKHLVPFLLTASPAEVEQYVNGENTRKGHAGKYGEREDTILLKTNNDIHRRHLSTLARELFNALQDELDAIPANSTVFRHLHEQRYKRHRLNRENIHKDYAKQFTYLSDIAYVDPSNLVDMDGIHYNPKDYLESCTDTQRSALRHMYYSFLFWGRPMLCTLL